MILFSILKEIWSDKFLRPILLVTALLVLFGAAFAYLTHRAKRAEKQAREAQINANRANDKAAGLEILYNSNNRAAEIEREKTKANDQAINSNTAFNSLNDDLLRDSNSFAGNYSDARARFCRNFPNDSLCRK